MHLLGDIKFYIVPLTDSNTDNPDWPECLHTTQKNLKHSILSLHFRFWFAVIQYKHLLGYFVYNMGEKQW